MSGKDFLNRHVLSWRRKVYSDWEDVTSSGRAFQVFGPATVNSVKADIITSLTIAAAADDSDADAEKSAVVDDSRDRSLGQVDGRTWV